MRDVTDRRKQLEQEQKQALAILTFKQNELKHLQRAQFVAEKEQEGVVQMLESTLDSMQASVLELEEKCRTQSQQFAWLSHELERFRLQAGDNPDTESYHQLTNGVKAEPEFNPYVSGLAKPLWPQGHHRRVLPSIGLKPGCTANASRLRPPFQHKHKPSPPDEVPAVRVRRTGKPSVFIVRHSYDPYSGPNHSPEDELPLRAGEYICVYGDMDEDGFYEGELMDGRSGLIPSNFVELLSSNDIMGLPQSSVHNLSYNYPQNYLKNQLRSDPQAPEEGVPERVQSLRNNGLEADTGELAADSVPYPWKLSLIKQLTNSIIIGWDPPLAPVGWGNMWSYNIFVDEELRLSLPFGSQTNAILERLDLNLKAYRVCVQSVQTDRGASDRLRCTLLVGRDVCMAPTQLRAERVTATSALLTWLSSNSNFMHTVSLNDEECWLVKPGDYSLALNDLRPRQLYKAQVEARSHHTPWELSLYGRQHKSATVTFTTLARGCLAAPEHVQLEAGPSPGIVLISWLPVGIDAVGRSNGVLVSGYAIYADKKKVLEVSSPKASNALMGSAQIQTLLTAQELTVRTMSPHGESSDSVPVPILPNLRAIAAAMPLSHTSGPPISAKGPPPDLPAAETSTLLHNPPVDAHLVRTSSSVHKATSTDCISSPPLQISLTSSSVAVQTTDAAIGTEKVQMKIPTVSVSQFPEHTDTIAEPRPPTGPIPISFQDVGPKADLQGPAVPLPQNPIPLHPSLLQPEPDDGSPRKSAWVEPVHKSPNEIDLTPKPQSAYCKDSSCMQKHLETQNGCCMSVMGLSSDITLGDDKNLCSVSPREEPPEQTREDSKAEPLEMDSSDEEVLARILRAQVPINKELFSIAEVTEEEDSCQETEEQKLQKSLQIPQGHKSSLLGKPAVSSSAASCPTIPNCPTHCSTMGSCHTHPAKNSGEPIYRLPSLDSTAHCATTLISPSHGPHVSGDPACGLLDPYSSAQCSFKSKCPTPQSKSLDIPVYQPPTEVAFNPSQSLISDSPNLYATSMTKSSSCALSSDCHFDIRSKSHQHVTTDSGRKNTKSAHDHSGYLTIPQPRSKPKHRVHYSDIVDTITYQKDEYDSDSSIYISSKEARRQRRKSHKPLHQRGLPERGRDRLRREALLRSQRASDNPPQVQYLDSKTLVRTRVPVTSGIEIDVEYGTEDDDANLSYGATGVVVEQMSSEWWVEGGSSSIFKALRPSGQQSPRVLPFEMEAPNPRYCHTSRGASLGTRQRGPSGVGDLAEWRQDYHTPSTCAKPDCKARSYSSYSGDPRSLYGQSTPLRTISGKTRAKAKPLKDADGVRLASPECVERERPPCQDGARIFVALFSYDPSIMSPNPDTAEEELRFKEGQIIKVYGDKDQDGFYFGESDGRAGFVPSNMVSEIQVDDELTKAQLLQKGVLSPEPSMANRDLSKPDSQPQELIPSRMTAIFDYDPKKNSPNDDLEVELSFHAGDVISVYGNVDEDGFFYGELNGRRGLVPSNFLKTLASLGDQATSGPEQPELQHEMPRLKQHSQKQRRKSVFALNP